MNFSIIKEALALIGILALAVSLWFLRGHSDRKIFDAKNETIKSLQDTVQSKEDIIGKDKALLDSGNTTAKSLQETIQSKIDLIGKDKALLEAKDEIIKSLQTAAQTQEAMIARDKALLEAKDETIKSLQETIASYQGRGSGLPPKNGGNGNNGDKDNVTEKVYPDDNGFDAQNLGSGFFAYQVFGPIKNPNNNKFPDKIPNHTPWKFGDGNSGIAANDSGMYLSGATNRDNNGATSTNGQAGFLEYKGSSISQSMILSPGTYTVTFDYEARRAYAANEIAVSLDGKVLFEGAPTDFNNFTQVTTQSITVTTSGEHELMFRALGSMGNVSPYPCTFIDNVCLNRTGPRPPGPNRGFPDIIEDAHLNPFPAPSQANPGARVLK